MQNKGPQYTGVKSFLARPAAIFKAGIEIRWVT